jgi:hypothetical protein
VAGHPGRFEGCRVVNIKSVAQLRALLFEMETTLGLVELSPNERDILYAINEVSSGFPKAARSEAIRNHPLAASIPQATYHRALKSLVQRGLVAHAPDTRAGHYVLTEQAQP